MRSIANDVLTRDATGSDAAAIAAIGSEAMPAQYAGLVDPVAVDRCQSDLLTSGGHRAVRFYQRHGLQVAQLVDGLVYYSERMGVNFPPDTRPFSLVLMRRRTPH